MHASQQAREKRRRSRSVSSVASDQAHSAKSRATAAATAAAEAAAGTAGNIPPGTPAPPLARSDSSTSLSNVRFTPYGRANHGHHKYRSESVSSLSAFSAASADSFDHPYSPVENAAYVTPQTRMSRSLSFTGEALPQVNQASVATGMPFDPSQGYAAPQHFVPVRNDIGSSLYGPGYRRPHSNSSPPVPVGLGQYNYPGHGASSLQASPVSRRPESMGHLAPEITDAWSGSPLVQGTIITPSGRFQPVLARLNTEQGSPHSTIASAIRSGYDTGSPAARSTSSVGSFWTDSRLASPGDHSDPAAFGSYDFGPPVGQPLYDQHPPPVSFDSYTHEDGLADPTQHYMPFMSADPSHGPHISDSFSFPAQPYSAAPADITLAPQPTFSSPHMGPIGASDAAFLESAMSAPMPAFPTGPAPAGHSMPPHGLTLPSLAAANAVEDSDMRTATRANFRESELLMPVLQTPAELSPVGEQFGSSMVPPSASTTPLSFAQDMSAIPQTAAQNRRRAAPCLPQLPAGNLLSTGAGQAATPRSDQTRFAAQQLMVPTSMSLPQHERPHSAPRPVSTPTSSDFSAGSAGVVPDSRLAAAFHYASSASAQPPTSLANSSSSANCPAPSPTSTASHPMAKSYSSSMAELSARYATGLSLSREGASSALSSASTRSNGAGEGLKVDASGRAVLPL